MPLTKKCISTNKMKSVKMLSSTHIPISNPDLLHTPLWSSRAGFFQFPLVQDIKKFFSNVEIRHNCFKNPKADYEIGTELMEHAKWIDARENNWGYPMYENFMDRIFDQVDLKIEI
jgi:hypothetical protein